MFVRLFVDENLDRHVPISKQPKEKIQAIIDSCTRQFPEFAPRARKRIRTYLKSCRRTKRSREQAGLDGINVRSYFLLTSFLRFDKGGLISESFFTWLKSEKKSAKSLFWASSLKGAQDRHLAPFFDNFLILSHFYKITSIN